MLKSERKCEKYVYSTEKGCSMANVGMCLLDTDEKKCGYYIENGTK